MQIVFDGAGAKQSRSHGSVSMVTFGSEQYQWHFNIDGGTADPDGSAARLIITANAGKRYTLPEASVTVLAGGSGTDRVLVVTHPQILVLSCRCSLPTATTPAWDDA